MSRNVGVLRLVLPIAMIIFLWVTMRTTYAYSGESMTGFGFPLSWVAIDQSTSAAFKVALLPLLFDSVVYFFSVWVGLRLLRSKILMVKEKLMRGVSVTLWLCAILSLSASVLMLTPNVAMEMKSVDAYFGANAARAHALALGLQPFRN